MGEKVVKLEKLSRINQLIFELSKLGRTDDIVKAAADREYQEKLLKEFDL